MYKVFKEPFEGLFLPDSERGLITHSEAVAAVRIYHRHGVYLELESLSESGSYQKSCAGL